MEMTAAARYEEGLPCPLPDFWTYGECYLGDPSFRARVLQ